MATSMNTYDANGFEDMMNNLPSIQDILSGDLKSWDSAGMSAEYAIAVSIVYELSKLAEQEDSELSEKVVNALTFVNDNFETEDLLAVVVTGLERNGISASSHVDENVEKSFKKLVDRMKDRY